MNMSSLSIAETFYSIQGEGMLTGIPSVFVRTSGCNLRCTWCDTPYTSWDPKGETMDVSRIVSEVLEHQAARHVVVTGGEPMISSSIVPLVEALQAEGLHVTIETAGTVWQPVQADLFSISPKLSNSVPNDPVWGPRHESRRIAIDVLRQLTESAEYQLKFVISSAADINEVKSLVNEMKVAEPWRVLLMAESRSVSELREAQEFLGEACKKEGFRYCDRLHLRLYGNTPGT